MSLESSQSWSAAVSGGGWREEGGGTADNTGTTDTVGDIETVTGVLCERVRHLISSSCSWSVSCGVWRQRCCWLGTHPLSLLTH